jgi:uncharacterized protein YndB with AHSA1/START domain
MKIWLPRIILGFFGLVIAVTCVLALMGRRQDAGVSRSSVEINASREQLWPWLDEPDKFKRWVSWVVEVQTVNPARGVGRQTVVMMQSPGSSELVRIEATLTEHAPPQRLAADIVSPGLFSGSQNFQLTDLGQGRTRVDVTNRIHYTSALVRLLEPLMTPSSTGKIDGDLSMLKKLAEAEVPPAEISAARAPQP